MMDSIVQPKREANELLDAALALLFDVAIVNILMSARCPEPGEAHSALRSD